MLPGGWRTAPIGFADSILFTLMTLTSLTTQIAPNPCGANVTNAPQFHITNLGVGPHDLNSIFLYKGMWQVFAFRQQCVLEAPKDSSQMMYV
jgi:hypothetical protein